MPRILLLLAIVITLVVMIRRAQALPPHQRRGAFIKILLGMAVVGVVVLTITGRMHWIGAALTGLLVLVRQTLPLIIRLLPALGSLKSQASASSSKQSEVRSAILKMTLDHDSGELSGEVLEGEFKGWWLDELDRTQLDELMAYCQQEDADSAQLLSSYLEQRFPDDASQSESTSGQQSAPGASMTRTEALAVLGLSEEATDDEIVAAHRALIQKLHPDRGGNHYLAAKINEAKDFLVR